MNDWAKDCMDYLRHLSGFCRGCLRRSQCDRCDVPRAKTLLQRGEALADAAPPAKSACEARIEEILGIRAGSSVPLRARDIALRSPVLRKTKSWTLARMVRTGLIVRTRVVNLSGRPEVAYCKPEQKRKRK